MFSGISHKLDATKQVISGKEAAIGLASVYSKRKAENVELSDTTDSRDETLEKGLEQVVFREGHTKKKRTFELAEMSTECGIKIWCW